MARSACGSAMRTKRQGLDLSTAISGTSETPMPAPTMARRLER